MKASILIFRSLRLELTVSSTGGCEIDYGLTGRTREDTTGNSLTHGTDPAPDVDFSLSSVSDAKSQHGDTLNIQMLPSFLALHN